MPSFEEQCTAAIASGKIHGVVLATRNKSGEHYERAQGTRTLLDGTQVPLQLSDIVFVASCTKFVTTIAALQCVEKGLLSLDADLRPQLSDLAGMGVFKNASKTDVGTIEPLRKPLTLRHLLTHSSGLSYDFMHPITKPWRAANPYANATGKGVTERFLMPLLFQPGEGWEYGVGLDWAGYLIEEATGMRLDQHIRENVLKPLGIPPTDFTFLPIAEGLSARMSDLSPADPNGYGLAASANFNIHEAESTACYGGGGGYTTALAFVTILNSILLNDGKILSPATVEEMHKPQLEPLARTAFNLNPVSTVSYDDATDTRTERDHGLGGVLVTLENDPCGLGKGSLIWGGGINSAWSIDPVSGTCGFAAPQMKIPIDFGVAQSLRTAFTKDLAGSFQGQSRTHI